MDTISLKVKPRALAGRSSLIALREGNEVPAVVYGHNFPAQPLSLERTSFTRLFANVGESTLLDLEVEGRTEPIKALVQDVQRDAVSDRIIHVDFRCVALDEKIKVEVRLEFVGEAPAVKGLGGTLVKNLEHLDVLALPTALVKSISVDISKLAAFGEKIRVHDLILPPGIESLTGGEVVVVLVEAPRSDEELAALEGTVELDASKVEVVKKEKKTEDEDAEKTEEAIVDGAKKKDDKKK